MKLHGLSKTLSGKWLLDVKFAPMAGMPNGFAGTGEELWREGPGSYTLIEEEHIPTPGGQAYLLGLFWWDSKSQTFRGMECNNQLPSACDLKGALNDITVTWNEKTLAIDEVETHDSKKSIWHEVCSNITPTSYIQNGEITQPAGSTTHLVTIRGTKAKE